MRWLLVLASACSGPAAAVAVDAPDPACATQPIQVTTHPHAAAQPTAIGQDLSDTRGWHGQLYFGYGDLDQNTGPIEISSYDPVADAWTDYLDFDTERIIRLFPIEDTLYVPAGDSHSNSMPTTAYAAGTTDHVWTTGAVPSALHVTAAVERAPGDVFLTGEDLLANYAPITTGAVWQLSAGTFQEVFPIAGDVGNSQPEVWFFNAAALDGTLYVGFGWTFDGTAWAHPDTDLGEFQRPVTFAGAIVSSTLGQLWAYDGTAMRDLDFTLFTGTGIEQTTVSPLPLFATTEDRLVAIDASGSVRATTDLATWTCLGQAPADVRSVGSLGGTVYFGGAGGRVYAYPAPSW